MEVERHTAGGNFPRKYREDGEHPLGVAGRSDARHGLLCDAERPPGGCQLAKSRAVVQQGFLLWGEQHQPRPQSGGDKVHHQLGTIHQSYPRLTPSRQAAHLGEARAIPAEGRKP